MTYISSCCDKEAEKHELINLADKGRTIFTCTNCKNECLADYIEEPRGNIKLKAGVNPPHMKLHKSEYCSYGQVVKNCKDWNDHVKAPSQAETIVMLADLKRKKKEMEREVWKECRGMVEGKKFSFDLSKDDPDQFNSDDVGWQRALDSILALIDEKIG